MIALSTSETSVNFYQTTRRNDPEQKNLHTRRRENLKTHKDFPLQSTYVVKTTVINKLTFNQTTLIIAIKGCFSFGNRWSRRLVSVQQT
jgi:hypothetical protein